MAKENANDKLKKWLEFEDTKVTKLQEIKFQVDHLFESATKNAHVLNRNEYMQLFAVITFETVYWLIEQAEKVERYEKDVFDLDESLQIARASRRDLLAYTKQLKEDNEKLQEKLNAKIMFVSNEKDEDMYVLQEKVIRYEKALKYYADRGFNKAKEVLEG